MRSPGNGVHVIGPTRRGVTKGGYSRAYLFEDERDDSLTLVDSLWDDDGHEILKYLSSIGRSPREITNIALTHAHRSHLGGVAAIQQLSGATVSCHATEAPIVEGARHAHPIQLWPVRPLILYPFRILSHLHVPKHVRCRVDRTDLETDAEVGPLKVIHTPGHTPGHLVFSYKDWAFAVGDAIATWPSFGPGWPGFNLDEAEYRTSLGRLVALRPGWIGPGHGDPVDEDVAGKLARLVPTAARATA
jgi:hydroxyacylglutathione hydrolase